jgi:hypothetical protein
MPCYTRHVMSMPLAFYSLTAAQVATWNEARREKRDADARQDAEARAPAKFKDDPNDWGDVVSGRDSHPDDVLQEGEVIEFDWEHFGLSFLIQQAAGIGYQLADLTPQVFGRNLGIGLNPDGTIHNTVALPPEEVGAGLAFLRKLDGSKLRAAWNPTKMAHLEIHPTSAWTEPETLDTLIEAFAIIRDLFERAYAAKNTLVVQIAI